MNKYRIYMFLAVTLLTAPLSSTADDEVHYDNTDWTTRHCLLEAHMVVDLSSPVPGVIARVKVKRGDKVRKGKVVVQLRSEVEQAMVDLNRAQVEFGKITALRNQELFEQELISEQEKDEIELRSEMSRLELAAAQMRLQQKNITSPINGIILQRLMDPGEYVGEDPILKIASLDPLYVEAVLPKELFGTVKNEMIADVALEAPIGGVYKAEVAVVDQAIDAASGTFGVRLTLPNPKNIIPVGLKCKVRFSSE
jgi:membrane fusion protein, multidrug efflux system